MGPSQFDNIARNFQTRRASRRAALAAIGSGLIATKTASIAAQDASPVPSDTDNVTFMFVQTFGAGSLIPKAGEDGVLVLNADHLAGQTLFFSDRPERIVGMLPTDRFLGDQGGEGNGTAQGNPPNAALVMATTGDQPTEIIVLELLRPAYDASVGAVTYDVRVLEDIDQIELRLQQEPLTVIEAGRDFSSASLFIDDCADGYITCTDSNGNEYDSDFMGFCYDSSIDKLCCQPCQAPAEGSWEAQCFSWYPDSCAGGCSVGYREDGWSPTCSAS